MYKVYFGNILHLLISQTICKNLNIIFFLICMCGGYLYINFKNIILICPNTLINNQFKISCVILKQ